MNAVSERLLLLGAQDHDAEAILVREYLRLGTDVDNDLIKDLLAQIKDEADAYLNNDFTDADGDPRPIPATISAWVLTHVARLYEYRMAGLMNVQEAGTATVAFSGEVDYTRLDRYRRFPGL